MLGGVSALQLEWSLGMYKHGHKLVGDGTAKCKLLIALITESQFADDAGLYATSEENFVTVAWSFVNVASNWGLTVSLVKTKGMKIRNQPSFVGGVPLCYQLELGIGSTISNDGEVDSDIDVNIRIAKTANALECLKKSIFTNHHLAMYLLKLNVLFISTCIGHLTV